VIVPRPLPSPGEYQSPRSRSGFLGTQANVFEHWDSNVGLIVQNRLVNHSGRAIAEGSARLFSIAFNESCLLASMM